MSQEETPVVSYHDQFKALQAVALLAIGCSEYGITRDRSTGPEFWHSLLAYLEQALAFSGGCSLWGVRGLLGSLPVPPLRARVFGLVRGEGMGAVASLIPPILRNGLSQVSGKVRVMTEVVSMPRVLVGER